MSTAIHSAMIGQNEVVAYSDGEYVMTNKSVGTRASGNGEQIKDLYFHHAHRYYKEICAFVKEAEQKRKAIQ